MAEHTDQTGDPAPAPRPGGEPDTRAQGDLDPRRELGEFLRTRRARLRPADLGLPEYGGRRRVPGLRREELALAAGVSVAYYTRLEQGNARNVSTEVLNAIATALGLSEAEHAHLLHLTRPVRRDRRTEPRRQRVRPALRNLLTAIDGVPAYVWGRRTDVLAWNRAASALFGDWDARAPRDRNWARVVFLEPEAGELFADWRTKAADVVGQLRLDAGRHPNDPLLAALVGELSVKSEEFRTMWAAHDVKRKTHDSMRMTHSLVGELTVHYETLTLPGDQGQALEVYHAEPGSASEEALRLLVSWGADAHAKARTPTRRHGPPPVGEGPRPFSFVLFGLLTPTRWRALR